MNHSLVTDLKSRRIGSKSHLFLVSFSGINLILGTIFFLYPDQVIPVWPWPVKELAVRFVGAIFLAIALGCWSALRAGLWQRAKVLPLVGSVFFGITSIIILSQIATGSSSLNAWAWALYFLAATMGLALTLWSHGWYRRPIDLRVQGPSWRQAKVFFRIQTLVVGIFGSLMLFFPTDAQAQFWPWTVATPTLQTFAALFLATCLATGWASLQIDRGRIRTLLPLDAMFPALALLAVGIHWPVIESQSPSQLVTAVWVSLYSFVAVGSTYLYVSSRKFPGE